MEDETTDTTETSETPGGGEPLADPIAEPVPVESGTDVGPEDAPSVDPNGPDTGDVIVVPEPGTEPTDGNGNTSGLGDDPGSQTSVIHLEDDRLR